MKANMKTLFIFCFFLAVSAESQSIPDYNAKTEWGQLTSEQRLQRLNFTTSAYRQQVFQMILAEASNVAKKLNLTEKTPIKKNDVTEFFISTPQYAKMFGSLGSIATSDYEYYFSVDNKFSSIVRANYDDELKQLIKNYHWPMWKVDTNAAYQWATQMLCAVSVDVVKLNEDCVRTVGFCLPDEKNKFFVPNYRISWKANDEPVALVEVFLPTKTLRDLSVEKSQYILRAPLQITNLNYLLSQTNSPEKTNTAKPK